jgi:hypothetical protein
MIVTSCRRGLRVLAAIGALTSALPVAAQDAVSTTEAAGAAAPLAWKIESAHAVGSGCPMSGRPAVFWISAEGDQLDVELPFRIDIAPSDARPTDSASCTLAIGVRVPAGYSYAPTHLRFGGRSYLPSGVQATIMTTYGFQGSGLLAIGISHRVAAPSTLEPFDFFDDLANTPIGLQWSRCGEQQVLNVNMVLHLQNSPVKQTGWAALSYATGLRLALKRCP